MSEQPKKEDKRKTTSGKNAAKARQAKLDKLKKKKEEEEKYQFDDTSDDSSDSEDEVIVVKPKKKSDLIKQVTDVQVQPQNDKISQELTELKELLKSLTIQKQKKKQPTKRSKQIIKIVNPPSTQPNNPDMDSIKKRILLNF